MKAKRGVNLGMWLAQYPVKDDGYFDSYITQDDIKRIARYGFDHVRLPIDYRIIESDENPGVYSDAGLSRIERAIEWALAESLEVILDLHHAPGYIFDALADSKLFDDVPLQDRFVNLWLAMSKRFSHFDENLIFEMLNEVVEPDSTRWNALAHRTIAAIRALDPTRQIVYGGNCYSSVSELKNIDRYPADGIIYTFHFYEPLLFTHQYAFWNDFTKAFASPVVYPGKAEGLMKFLASRPEFAPLAQPYIAGSSEKVLGIDYLDSLLDEVRTFLAVPGTSVFCGEFGVFNRCDDASSLNWVRDMTTLMKDIPYTYWNWKSDDFGIVTCEGKERIPGLVKAILP